VVQCTNPVNSRVASAAEKANSFAMFAEPTAVAGPTDGCAVTAATGADALVDPVSPSAVMQYG
jgi:hypothetical protein